MIEDWEKILKSMQLGLFRLRQIFKQQKVDENNINNTEMYGIIVYRKTFFFYSMHYVDGLYLADQFEEFTIPDNSFQLIQLSDIIKIQRVINLHNFIQSSLNDKNRVRRKLQNIENAIKASL
ncbi:hypothetical protein Glove_4g16 [Diversispora epigaea]|uniref:Uncharacterized protein n=1 Tax=Diversispora epigaea TaxID=1348612 RepID=A0A397JVU1_9GLOM|nr:hypothetical protein Glove_4g16 [Diversispora epigaea]